MCKPPFPHLIENLVAGCVVFIGIALPSAYAQQKTKPADQLYIEVSAVGSNDYFYDPKMDLRESGKAVGVKTEYVGPADFDMSAMITAFEQSIARKPAGIIVVGFEPSLNAIIRCRA
jgi:ribose transport system substrate-binding protein